MTELFEKLWRILTFIVPRPCTIAPNEAGCKLRYGKVVAVLGPGWSWWWPPIHEMHVLDVTEQVPDIRCITAITSDGYEVAVGSAVRYRICDVQRAMFCVEDFDRALETLVMAKLHDYINSHTRAECATSKAIEDGVIGNVRALATRRWGLEILGLWVTDMGTKYLRLVTDRAATEPEELVE